MVNGVKKLLVIPISQKEIRERERERIEVDIEIYI